MCALRGVECDHGLLTRRACRNAVLEAHGLKKQATKTGTTIVGLCFKDGIVLGADTRSTQGSTVADKNCQKIHYIADNIYCCGAGTAADTEFTTALISSKIELHRMATGKQPRVVTALTMLKRLLFRNASRTRLGPISGALSVCARGVISFCAGIRAMLAPHSSSVEWIATGQVSTRSFPMVRLTTSHT